MKRRISFITVSVVLVVATVFATAVICLADASADLQRGKDLFTEGKYDEAISVFTAVVSADSNLAPEATLWIGKSYQYKTDYANAVEYYNNVLTDYPTSTAASEAYYRIGATNEAAGDLTKAIQAHQAQISGFSTSEFTGRAILRLGDIYRQQGKYDSALAQYNKAISDFPDQTSRARLLIGICYQDQKKYTEAIAALDQCIATGNGSSNEARLRKDDCLRGQGNYTDEIAYLHQLYNDCPDLRAHALTRESEAQIEGMHDPTTAIDLLNRVISETPDDPLAVEALARIAGIQLYYLRDFTTARAGLQSFMDKHPDYPALIVVANDLAFCSYLQKDYATAAALFISASKLKEVGNYAPRSLYMAADSYMRIKDYTNAKAQADLLIAKYPKEPTAELATQNYELLTGSWMNGGTN